MSVMTSCASGCAFQDTPFLANTCGATFTVFMGLVETLLRSHCDIADPCDRAGKENFRLRGDSSYDFIVVGAGVAGSVVATRLSENPDWNVLLVEAGPEEPTATQVPSFAVSAVGTPLDWNYTTQAQEHACLANGGVCKWPRGKMVAGTSAMQGMMYTRPHPSIFDDWAKAGNTGWGYQDLLPYFIMSENNKNMDTMDEGYHGTEGPLVVQHFPNHPPMAEDVVKAGVAIGYRNGDLNGRNQTGIAIAQMMVYKGLRGSTARMYLRKASRRPNLHVATNSHVSRVIIDPATQLATGIEVYDEQGTKRTVHATREVILSAGAVGSPQLLLLSGVGPAADLLSVGVRSVRDLPGVGGNLRNHVSAGVGFYINDTSRETLNLDVLDQFLDQRNGPMSGTGLTQTTAFMLSKYAESHVPDLQVFFDGFNAACSRTGLDWECGDGSVSGDCGRRYIYARPTTILPQSKGYLKLRSADPFDHPLIDPKYLSVQRDADILVDGIKTVIRMTETESLSKWGFQLDTVPVEGCEGEEFGSDEYWGCLVRQHTGAENHPGGSCKMGPPSDPEAVVDPQLRVHGIPNLRVADASIFPYIPNSNPISVITLVGEKAAVFVKDTWAPPTLPAGVGHEFTPSLS